MKCQWNCGREATHFCRGCGKMICSHPTCMAKSAALAAGEVGARVLRALERGRQAANPSSSAPLPRIQKR